MTARTWPDHTWPTPEQLAAWLLACDDAERLETVTRALHDMETASRCFQADHDGIVEEVAHLRRWKAEATEVLNLWEAVWELLDRPGALGESKAKSVLAEVRRLQALAEGCDCTTLCEMGPTCPGGMLAGLPESVQEDEPHDHH